MRVEIRELQRKLGLTTVMVTHDQEEALTMADRLVVMAKGGCSRSARSATSTSIRPNAFVAGFVGRTNFLRGRVEAPGCFRSESGLSIRCNDGSGTRAAARSRCVPSGCRSPPMP